jgi:hypothetical protein
VKDRDLSLFDGEVLGGAGTHDRDRVSVGMVDGVVFQKISKIVGRGEIVHRHNLKLWPAEKLAKEKAADAAETIDCDASRSHLYLLYHRKEGGWGEKIFIFSLL